MKFKISVFNLVIRNFASFASVDMSLSMGN
jgi:hypothetical protein